MNFKAERRVNLTVVDYNIATLYSMEGIKKRKSENGHGDGSRKQFKVRVVYLHCFKDCRRIKAILRYPKIVSFFDLLAVLTND